jgi:hypothetical protein
LVAVGSDGTRVRVISAVRIYQDSPTSPRTARGPLKSILGAIRIATQR